MQHKHVYTLAIGDRAMYDFMDDNPSVVGYPASWVNNPSVIRKNPNMVSVNSAIEVDITGQIAPSPRGAPFLLEVNLISSVVLLLPTAAVPLLHCIRPHERDSDALFQSCQAAA